MTTKSKKAWVAMGVAASFVMAQGAFAQTGVDKDKTANTSSTTASTTDKGDQKNARYNGVYHGVRCEKLIGANVKNPESKSIGEIQDLAIDPDSGRIAYAVLSFGGFMGMGDKFFAVPFKAIDYQADGTVVLNVTKSRLENATGFDQKNWPNMADERWARDAHQAFDHKPYWDEDGKKDGAPKRIVKASALIGQNINNSADETIGEVDDLVVDTRQGHIAYAVLACGGFLGMGEDLVAVPWDVLNTPTNEGPIQTQITKAQLTEGPRFKKDQWPQDNDNAYVVRIYTFYNIDPYWNDDVDASGS